MEFIKNLFDINSKLIFLYELFIALPGLVKFFITVLTFIIILLGIKTVLKDVIIKLPVKIVTIVSLILFLLILLSFFMS